MSRLFDLFHCYWSVIQKRRNGDINSTLSFIITSLISSNLKREWIYQRGYSLADLKKIVYALDISLDQIDPTQYIDYRELYISKLIKFKSNN